MKKLITIIAACFLVMILTGCGGDDNIHLISREAGSGTRDGFTELTGIKEDGHDKTAVSSEITSSTFVVIKSVAGDKNAIGYVSLGTMQGDVKPLCVNGSEPTAENIKNKSYPLVRTFNIVDNGKLSREAASFMNFVMSEEGQKIIEEEGYVPAAGEQEHDGKSREAGSQARLTENLQDSPAKGRIVIAGSTSVAPLIDVLADRYMDVNPNIKIELQQTGSGAGITSVLEGACDMGISSRELTEQEQAKGAVATPIALDGIAVIVHPSNSTKDMTVEEIRDIFTGRRKAWR